MSSHGLAGDLASMQVRTEDSSGRALAWENSIPQEGAVGFIHGALWINTAATKNTERIFINVRTVEDALWAPLTIAAR